MGNVIPSLTEIYKKFGISKSLMPDYYNVSQ